MVMSPSSSAPARESSEDATIRVLDLFAGCGGLSQGFHQASRRYQTVEAVEQDLCAAASFAVSFPSTIVHACRIEDWLEKNSVPQVDVVVGGPPCQGFSQLGKQDVQDERNQLWNEYVAAVERAQPSYFVMENVPAFLVSPQFDLFRAAMEPGGRLANYDYHAEVLNAADYGAPQRRHRVIVLGWRKDLPDPGMPAPTRSRNEWKTVRQALKNVPTEVTGTDLPLRTVTYAEHVLKGPYTRRELHVTRSFAKLSLDRFAKIPAGGSRFQLPDELQAPCWKKHSTGTGDVMGRLHWDQPSVTIRTEFIKPEKGRYIHPDEDRAITPYEGALLQGFPASHRWVGSKTAIVKQIGNAVPIPLGKAIARHILKAIDATDNTLVAVGKQ